MSIFWNALSRRSNPARFNPAMSSPMFQFHITQDGEFRAANYQKVGVAMAADSAHLAGLDDIEVVRVEAVAAVTAKTAAGQSHLEVPNSRSRFRRRRGASFDRSALGVGQSFHCHVTSPLSDSVPRPT
jgi:hypothetical protein